MKSLPIPSFAFASLLGFSGVALGAFGAHALQSHLSPEALEWWHTGVLYQLLHAAAFAAVALSPARRARTWTLWSWGIGVLLFSGSLYALALTGWRLLGVVTPLGGLAFLGGWVALSWLSPRRTPKND